MTSLNSFSTPKNRIACHNFDQTAYRVSDHSQKAEQLSPHDFHQILDSFQPSQAPSGHPEAAQAKLSLLDALNNLPKFPSHRFSVAELTP
jgi:hypothetical protein